MLCLLVLITQAFAGTRVVPVTVSTWWDTQNASAWWDTQNASAAKSGAQAWDAFNGLWVPVGDGDGLYFAQTSGSLTGNFRMVTTDSDVILAHEEIWGDVPLSTDGTTENLRITLDCRASSSGADCRASASWQDSAANDFPWTVVLRYDVSLLSK